MERIKRSKGKIIILFAILTWIIFAQSCMKFRISDSKAIKQFAEKGVTLHTETVKINGFDIHFAKTGNDTFPTLFFIHGSPGSWDAFSVYMKDKDLLAKFRMVSVDRPGYGYSQFGDSKNLVENSLLLSPLLTYIKNDKPIYIIGHSLGGPLALQMAAENKNVFSGLVLLAASVDPAEEPKEKWRGFLYKTNLDMLLPGAIKPSNQELYFFKEDVKALPAQFAKVNCNVFIVHGDKDKFVPVGNAYYAEKMFVNAKSVQVKILKDAPHFIPWEPWYKYVKEVLLELKPF